mgnify:FL=1
MHGKLIAIDGVDSSGKGLQTDLLLAALQQKGERVRKLSFPVYSAPSSAPVREYLAGHFGGVNDVNGYAASLLFAVDRYASYKSDWERDYRDGCTFVCDRYVSSNAIHQSVKLPQGEREAFLRWVEDVEYEKMGLPRPDLTIFLDMPVEVALQLMKKRYHGDESLRDIHEADEDYLRACHEAAIFAADRLGWERIACVENGALLTPQAIFSQVLERVGRLYAAL